MTANEISMPVAPPSPRISATVASPSAQTVDPRNPSTNENSYQDQQTIPVDSVTIFNKLQDTKREVRKEEAKPIKD